MRTAVLIAGAGILALTMPARSAPTRVAISVGSLGNPFFVAAQHGAENAIKSVDPTAEVTTASSDYDLNKQVSQIENFVSAGVNIILLNAADPLAIGPAVKRAEAAKVVVAAFDVSAQGANVTAMTDNIKAGQISCRYLAEKLGHKGNVVILNGPPVSSVVDRVKGCKQALAQYSQITLENDNQNGKASRDGGFAVTQDLLTRYRSIDGMFAINEEEAIGADLAMTQANARNILLTAVDGSPGGVAALKSPSSHLIATAAQDPYDIARTSVKLALDFMKHPTSEPQTVLLQPILVTRDDVGTYAGWNAK